jgi:CheY-like chemotaxis protein
MEDPAMKSALPVLVQKRYASPNAERALLQISQCVEREGPDLLAIDRFKDIHNPLPTAPDIAFIDIGLPGIDGHEVGRRIRGVLGSRGLLVALTAYGREQDRRRLSQVGFDAHLLKPAGYADPIRVLARAAGRGELR